MLRYRQPIYLVPIQATWHRVLDKQFAEHAKTVGVSEADLDYYISEYQKNPLAFFLPHGRVRKDRHKNDGAAFLNDWESDLLLVRAPNQVGKSAVGAIRTALNLIPCEPDWPIFTSHGVDYHEWEGPKIAVVASYEYINTYEMWESAYMKFLPRHELGRFSPGWGMYYQSDPRYGTFGEAFKGEEGRPRRFSQGFKRGVETLQLACGSKIVFMCYHQNLGAWTGRQCDVAHMDEQPPEDLFDELSQRQTTRGEYHPIFSTMTPHCVESRPDTGANSWLKRKVIDQGVTKGRKFAEYVIDMDCVPDEIIPPKEKKAKHIQWVVEPEAMHDDKKVREGKARYYAEWEVGGGIVVSAWNPEIHMIEPFDLTKFHPTLYRMIDHGENPCAGLLVAVLPWGDAVAYCEYYEFGNSIAKNAQHMVEVWCKNKRRKDTDFVFEGQTWDVYSEIEDGSHFYASELDAKSYGSKLKESGRTIGQAYNDNGLMCSPADARQNVRTDKSGALDLLKEWFELNRDRKHINERLGRPVPEVAAKYGAPRMYVFNGLKWFKTEIEGWLINPKTGMPLDRNDHLMSACKFFTARDRPYMGDWRDYGEQQESDAGADVSRSNVTGY